MSGKELRRIVRKSRGACPQSEALIRFAEDSLAETDKSQIAEHLLLCGVCANDIRLLKESQNPADMAAQIDPVRKKEIEQRFQRFLRLASGPPSHRAGLLRMAAVAMAAIMVLFSYPAYVGLKLILADAAGAKMAGSAKTPFKKGVEENTVSPAGTEIASSDFVRFESAVRGTDLQAGKIVIRSKADLLGMLFFVPIQDSPNVQYDCRITRGSAMLSESRDIKSFDGLGNFVLMVNARRLPPSHDYLLVVTENGKSVRKWQFPFAIEK